jgi:hypothetical protein
MPNADIDMFGEFDQAAEDFRAPGPDAGGQAQPAPKGAPPPAIPGDNGLEQIMEILESAGKRPEPAHVVDHPVQRPVADDKQFVPYDRFQQVNQENEYLRSVVERAVGGHAPAVEPSDPNALPAGVDPEIYGYVQPIIEMEREKMMQEFAPILEEANRKRAIEQLTATVPGFEPEMMAEIEQAYLALPVEVQTEYRGRVGIEALAYRVVGGTKRNQPGTNLPRPAAGHSRAHSISRSSGLSHEPARQVNVNDLSPEQYAQLKLAIARRGAVNTGLSDNEPDPLLDGRI